MRTACVVVCLLLPAGEGMLFAQTPAISNVVNGASFEANRLAPGGQATVLGSNLGTSTSIAVTVGGKAAKVTFASPAQLNIEIPWEAPLDKTTIQVGTSAPLDITLAQCAPGLAGTDSSGTIQAVRAGNAVVTAANPAKPGETISIFGTGWGPVTPAVPSGERTPTSPPVSTTQKPVITVGGVPATVIFAGLLPGEYGFNQATFTVPAVAGGPQPVVLTIGGAASTPRTLAVASGPLISRGVKNAASNVPIAAAGGGLAQGSYIAIYGSGLGPATAASAPIPYATSLAGASVTITPAGGAPVQAFVTYAADRQINAILPSDTAPGKADVTVTFGGATSPPYRIRVVRSSFGIFSTGYPVGAAATVNLNTAILYNLLTNATNGGDVLELFGTGLGPITVGDNVAPGAVSPTGIDVKVLIAGQVITPLYAGRSADYPALDQINFILPASGIPDSCFVPLAVSVNGAVSNYATLAKATGGRTCQPPLGLSAESLARLDLGGKINIGQLSLSRSSIQASFAGLNLGVTTEQAGAIFGAVNGAALFGLSQTPGAVPPLNVAGTCLVQTIDAISPPLTAVAALPQPLNAGASLTLNGPANKSKDLPNQGDTGYGAFLAQASTLPAGLPVSTIPGVPTVPAGLPTSFIEPGVWAIRGAGGSDIGPFTANITVPTPLSCTNCGSLNNISRSQPLTISWTGGGGSQDYVQIGGFSTAPSLADPSANITVIFSCTARASDNTFTVPVEVLNQLPPNSGDILSGNFGVLTLVNGLGSGNATFTAPNLDFGYFGYSSILTRLVAWE